MLRKSSVFFFSSRRRHTRWTGDWSSDVCSSDLRSGEVLARFRTFLVGRRREQRVARLEVCIEPAVREAGLLHHVGDPDAFVAVLANGARRRAQNPLAGFLLLGAGLDSCHMTYIIFAKIGLCQALLGIRLRTGSKARRRPGFQPRELLRSDCAREEADSARVPVGPSQSSPP